MSVDILIRMRPVDINMVMVVMLVWTIGLFIGCLEVVFLDLLPQYLDGVRNLDLSFAPKNT